MINTCFESHTDEFYQKIINHKKNIIPIYISNSRDFNKRYRNHTKKRQEEGHEINENIILSLYTAKKKRNT